MNIIYHKTLLRQITKYIGGVDTINPKYTDLFKAINDTYLNFDEDRLLMDRSIEISSRELSEYISILKSTLESSSDGILVVDNNGKTNIYNKKFAVMWGIPEDILYTRDDKKMFDYILVQLKDPNTFINKINELYSKSSLESYDSFELKDGRIFERYSKPQMIGEKIVGRVWSFRDITDQKKTTDKLKSKYEELDKMNKFMIDRELKMIELKKEISELKIQLENK